MKTKTAILLAVGFNLAMAPGAARARIGEVFITPQMPYPDDTIHIHVLGGEVEGPVFVNDTESFADGTSLRLDMFISTGPFQIVTPWSYTEDIGVLPAGTYDLAVHEYLDESFACSYETGFEVVPEPAGMLMLAWGLLGVCRCARKRRRFPQTS